MQRLIDADKLPKFTGYALSASEVAKAVENAPTVDAVEVVRCKDCIHYYADPWGYGNCVFEGGVSRRTKESDFCSWGERKEDAEKID